MNAFSTDVLNVTLQNTPDMLSLMTEVVNVKPFFGQGKVPPKMDAFSTDVLNVTLQNTPDMVSLITEVVNVKPFFGWGKVPPKWMPLAQMFSM